MAPAPPSPHQPASLSAACPTEFVRPGSQLHSTVLPPALTRPVVLKGEFTCSVTSSIFPRLPSSLPPRNLWKAHPEKPVRHRGPLLCLHIAFPTPAAKVVSLSNRLRRRRPVIFHPPLILALAHAHLGAVFQPLSPVRDHFPRNPRSESLLKVAKLRGKPQSTAENANAGS